MQPVTIPATLPTQPVVTMSGQTLQVPQFCALCTLIGRQCPNNNLMPIHPEWSDPEEEEKDLNKQEEDWDGMIQKQRKKKNEKSNKVMRKFPN